MSGTALVEARAAIDRALAARPQRDGVALAEATRSLCRHRDALRRKTPECGTPNQALKAVNAAISLLHAVHFPLDATPWILLEAAREGVDALALAAAPAAGAGAAAGEP